MKRIIICAVLFMGMIAVSLYSSIKVGLVNTEIDTRINAIIEIAGSGNREEIVSMAKQLTAYWEEEENDLIHFIRHSNIDMISTSVARLPKLAEYGDLAEFSAELESVRRQMEHIINSERLTFDNLF